MSLKGITTKIIASLMTIYMVFGNVAIAGIGVGKVIAEDAKVPAVIIESQVQKYIPYENEQSKGVVLQEKVSIAQDSTQETYKPVSKVELEIAVPSLNEILPTRVSIITVSTQATNGKEEGEISQNYNAETGLLTIFYENTENYNQYQENAKDEFEIIYIYPAEAKVAEELETTRTIKGKIEYYAENSIISSENTEEIKAVVKEKVGEITNYETIKESEIYKGYMYANQNNKANHETEYKTTGKVSILNSEIVDETEIKLEASKYIYTENEEEKELKTNTVIYKTSKVEENEFGKIYGENGYIDIYLGETKYATVNYVEEEENKKYATTYHIENAPENNEAGKIEYPEGTKEVTIKTSKPQTEGILKIENTKAIKAVEDYGIKVEEIEGITENNKITSIKKYQVEEEIKDENGQTIVDTEGNIQKETKEKIIKITEKENKGKIALKEPTAQMKVEMSNSNLSTLATNQTKIILTLNDTNSSCILYEAGQIEIDLPENITSAKILSAQALYKNGLNITNATIKEKKVILTVEGKQTSYDTENLSGGVNIVIDLEIDIEDTVASHEETLQVTYGKAKTSTKINIVSKYGVLMLSKWTGYNEEKQTTTSIDSNLKTVELSEEGVAREATQTLTIINNYGEDIKNFAVIGKIGYSNEQISSTLNTNLTQAIKTNKTDAKVYYSENKDSKYNDEGWSENFSKTAKAYKIVINNNTLAARQKLQIQLKVEIPANLGYNQKTYFRTQANYYYNNENKEETTTFGMLTKENALTVNSTNTQETLTATNGTNIPIKLEITPIITESYVHANQLVTYKVKVENNSDQDLSNIIIKNTIPENAIYTYKEEKEANITKCIETVFDKKTKEVAYKIEKLKANRATEFETILTMENVEQEQEVINKIQLIYNEQTMQTQNTLKLKPSLITASLKTDREEQVSVVYRKNETVEYYLTIKNISSEKIKNTKVSYQIPQYLEYKEGGLRKYDIDKTWWVVEDYGTINNNIFEYNIDKLEPNQEIKILIRCKVLEVPNFYEAKIVSIANVELNQDIYQTNIKTIETKQAAYTISLDSDVKESKVLKSGDRITYTITVKNIGKDSIGFGIQDNIPEELEVEKIEYNKIGEDTTIIETNMQNINLTNLLQPSETLLIKIEAKVKNVEEEKDYVIEVINKASIIIGEENIDSNSISLKIKQEKKETEEDIIIGEDFSKLIPPVTEVSEQLEVQPPQEDEPTEEDKDETNQDEQENSSQGKEDNPSQDDEEHKPVEGGKGEEENPQEQTYNISGKVWLDSNKNGKKDEEETLIEGITVSLIDTITSEIVKDEQGNNITVLTNSEGFYSFTNIKKGTYLVMFEFNTTEYAVSTYKTEGIEENLNSDVILKEITIEGQTKQVGITDNIEINNTDITNIDIGLIENATFDISLVKGIQSVTIITPKGAETKEYNSLKNITKVDLVAKYMNDTEVLIKYKFLIKNEGETIGYVDTLVDNLPSGLEFSSELNKDWYKGTDGKLYTNQLQGLAINPGEISEVELLLTKTMTEENTGTFKNNAEIQNVSNLANIQEQNIENNKSSAELIISIKTGSIILYLGITLGCISIIAIGAYIIKNKILDREN